MNYESLQNPNEIGAKIIKQFASTPELENVMFELNNPTKVEWTDSHETYKNVRGLTIVQNHFSYAHKLSRGDQAPLEELPKTTKLYKRTEGFVRSLSKVFRSLNQWKADELTFHRYDDQEVGLSRHRDNARFVGMIAILAIDGECDLVIKHDQKDVPLTVLPGDLCLLRAPGLIDTDKEIRPEHSVENLRTPTRTSMMLRANNRPDEAIPGFSFSNWSS